MNTKTPRQIAFSAYFQNTSDTSQNRWESAAAAVIAHHEASRAQSCNPVPKFKVGDKVKTNFGSTGVIDRISADGWHFIGRLCYRDCNLRPIPWTLPAPPHGREWHRATGWKEEMLPAGYRPLMLHEMTGEECTDVDWMDEYADSVWRDGPDFIPVLRGSGFFRTRRPLPPTHEIKITLPQLTLTSGKFSFASV